jgi:hypothetical protein
MTGPDAGRPREAISGPADDRRSGGGSIDSDPTAPQAGRCACTDLAEIAARADAVALVIAAHVAGHPAFRLDEEALGHAVARLAERIRERLRGAS